LAHFILWALTKYLKFNLIGGFDISVARYEMTDENLKAIDGSRFGNLAILANCKSCNIEVNLIRKFCFQNLRILKRARQKRFEVGSAKF